MDVNKTNSGGNNCWILCHSKSFPGKYYYFNVNNGEAVWSLNSNEKMIPKIDRGNIQKIANKHHGYPEPCTPPEYSPITASANAFLNTWPDKETKSQSRTIQNVPVFGQQVPIFGQQPNFTTNLQNYMPFPNIFWTPVQLPYWPYFQSDTKKPSVETVPLTSETEKEVVVHTSGISLNSRFVNYKTPSFNKESKFVPFTPLKKSGCKIGMIQEYIPEYSESFINTQSETVKNNVKSKATQTASRELDIYEDIFVSYDKENASLNSLDKSKNVVVTYDCQEKTENFLSDSDLRFKLMTKRKQMLVENKQEPIEKKKPKVHEAQCTPKKKVTFNLENSDSDCSAVNNIDSHIISENVLRNTAVSKNTRIVVNNTLRKNAVYDTNYATVTDNTYDTLTMDSVQTLQNNITRNNTAKDNITIKVTNSVNDIPNFNLPHKKYTINQYNSIPVLNKAMPETLNTGTQVGPYTKKDTSKNDILIREGNNTNNMLANQYASESILKESHTNIALNNAGSDAPLTVPAKMPVVRGVKDNAMTMNIPMSEQMFASHEDKDVWYLVADMDVLLDNQEMVDKIMQSDDKCRLLIPHALRNEIELMCIGDCRGQQRVLVARQLSRKMSASLKQIIVESPPIDDIIAPNTTDHILKCCVKAMKDHYCVVLITNDGNLKIRAKALHIPCYTAQDIMNGAIIKPRLFAELKRIKMTINNTEITENNLSIQSKTSGLFSSTINAPVDTFKKQLFVEEKDSCKNYDILYNITKEKSKNSLNISNNDDNFIPLEINKDVRKSFKDSTNRTSFFSGNGDTQQRSLQSHQNDEITGKIVQKYERNFEENVPSSNNQKSKTSNFFQDQTSADPVIYPRKVNTFTTENNIHNINNCNRDVNNTSEQKDQINKVTTAAKQRIDKIINTSILSSNLSKNNTQNEIFKTQFKIPKINPLKSFDTPPDSKNVLGATDHVRSSFKYSELTLEERLKEYSHMATDMYDTIKIRMDEWICIFTQIMEELLNYILQKESMYTNKISATNLQESLICVKMLYNDWMLKDIITLLVKLLSQSTCNKGKIKVDTDVQKIMKIIGCGVLLVESLKSILPELEVLSDCESYFRIMLDNMKGQGVDLELSYSDLPRSESPRADIGCPSEKTKHNFTKDKSYVIDYLKKHFKSWAEADFNGLMLNGNIKVVRMEGKNLKRLKINKNKSVSYTHANEDNLGNECTNETLNIFEDNHQNNDSMSPEKAGTKMNKLFIKSEHILSKDKRIFPEHISENIVGEKAISKENNCEPKTTDVMNKSFDSNDFPTQGHTFTQNDKATGPKMIRNVKLIDEYENKMKNKEPQNILESFELDINSNSNQTNDNNANNLKTIIINDNDSITNKSVIITHNKISYKNNFYNLNCGKNTNSVTYDIISLSNSNSISQSEANSTRHDNYENNCSNNKENENNNTRNENNNTRNENNKTITDDSNDSGFENESTQAHALVKTFLNELSCSFKLIYNFIVNFTTEIRGETLGQDQKNILHNKASKCLEEMDAIIEHLKNIIQRESRENTVLKNLLLTAGVEAINDKRITRYRQIVLKCLEQAQILESALRIIVCITIGDLKAISNSDSLSNNLSYINIFE